MCIFYLPIFRRIEGGWNQPPPPPGAERGPERVKRKIPTKKGAYLFQITDLDQKFRTAPASASLLSSRRPIDFSMKIDKRKNNDTLSIKQRKIERDAEDKERQTIKQNKRHT